MTRTRRIRMACGRAVIAAWLIALPVVARPQAGMVPMEATVYRDIDALGAAGLLDSLVVGVRPYSRREVVRLLREAQRNLAHRPAEGSLPWAERTIAAQLARYDRDRIAALESVRLDATY